MGVVHLARGEDGDRVALKVLRPHIVGDHEARSRLAREVSSLRLIRSRWVAEIIDADPWAEVPYVATRYVPGLSLHDHVVEEGPVTGRDLTWFAGCLAEGLACVHAVGVLHRDVKPSNVLMEGRTPILIDFGLARVADDPRLTHTGWLLGTPGYLAPEILYGDDATTASDVHSWAATVAYAATGSPPFGRGPAMAIMDRVRRGEHDLSSMAGPLRDVLAAALDPEPERRPVLDDLLAWLRPQTTRPTDPPHRAPHAGAPEPVTAPAGTEPTAPIGLLAREHGAARTAFEAPVPAVAPLAAAMTSPPTRMLTVVGPQDQRASVPPSTDEQPDGVWEPWTPPRVPLAERARRALLLLGLGLALAAGVAAFPWAALLGSLLVAWLLRAGSLSASATDERRARRGRTWYDRPLSVLNAPWDVVRAVPGTLLLALFALGLATSAGLLAYAGARDVAIGLGTAGVALAASWWWGPGAGRVRSPVNRVVHPVARTLGGSLLALALVAAGGGALAVSARGGPDWAPLGRPPLVDPLSAVTGSP